MEVDDPLRDEGRRWINSCVKVEIFQRPNEYTRSKATQRVRECFIKSPSQHFDELLKDPMVLPEKDENGELKATFTILDISEAVSYLDRRINKFDTIPIETVDSQGNPNHERTTGQGGPNYETTSAGMPCRVDLNGQPTKNSPVEGAWCKGIGKTPTQQSDGSDSFLGLDQDTDKYRAAVMKEFKESKSNMIGYGSGFIISAHLCLTCYHVTGDKETKMEIRISNKVINKLPCKVIDTDNFNDLALLYCRDLNVNDTDILALPLCAKVPLVSQGVFIFGYPFTHSGKIALFSKGNVSGLTERYGRQPFIALNCSVCPGESGGPVFRWIQGQLNVVAVLAQKHKKHILEIDEKNIVESIRSSLPEQTSLEDHFPSERLHRALTFRTLDAVEVTHCQFGKCNAVPGDLVTKFIENARKNDGNAVYRNELDNVVIRYFT